MTPEENDFAVLQSAANKLNRMIEADNVTMFSMFGPSWICEKELANTSAFCYSACPPKISVNMLGIIIGCLPLQTNTYTLALDIVSNRLLGIKVVNCKLKSNE